MASPFVEALKELLEEYSEGEVAALLGAFDYEIEEWLDGDLPHNEEEVLEQMMEILDG